MYENEALDYDYDAPPKPPGWTPQTAVNQPSVSVSPKPPGWTPSQSAQNKTWWPNDEAKSPNSGGTGLSLLSYTLPGTHLKAAEKKPPGFLSFEAAKTLYGDFMGRFAASSPQGKVRTQQQQLKQQGYQPANLNYSAPGSQSPADIRYKTDGATTTYQVPGVKGSATFQGQRKGGGSFTVAANRTLEEQQAINQTVAGINAQTDALRALNGKPSLAEEQQQAARERDFKQVQNWLSALDATDDPAQRSALLKALMPVFEQQQQQQNAEQQQENLNRRYDLDREELDVKRMTAQQREQLSRDWLAFQQWRSQQADELKGRRPRSDRSSMPKPAYVSPP